MRRSEQVAQVVIDFRHRKPEPGEPVFLMQHRGELGLHGGEFALGSADLVKPARRRNHAIAVFRVSAERNHVRSDATHRPHKHVMERQIDQRRGDRGDQKRQ